MRSSRTSPRRIAAALALVATTLAIPAGAAGAAVTRTPKPAAAKAVAVTCTMDAVDTSTATSHTVSRQGTAQVLDFVWDPPATCSNGITTATKFAIAMRVRFSAPTAAKGRLSGTLVLTFPTAQPENVVRHPARVSATLAGSYTCSGGTCEIQAKATGANGKPLIASITGRSKGTSARYANQEVSYVFHTITWEAVVAAPKA